MQPTKNIRLEPCFARARSPRRSATQVFAAFAALAAVTPQPLLACGGFFCQQVPIDQAGEQIIFRQDGDTVTAVVLIQYTGEARDFSWVVPVFGIPEVDVGSDLVFGPLELATRPVFALEVRGAECDAPEFNVFPPSAPGGASSGAPNDADGVEVLDKQVVGPFDVTIVRSTNAQSLATWLTDNDFDLSSRGRELIEPYVLEDMNFVAVKLQQDRGVGDIQPLIMRYQTTVPMIPIRLTGVAAMPNMGVLVWLLGDARAVPTNYLAVEPNYTLLNWYAGTFAAYAGYQGLITLAMDEAGGQGFATDYAGTDLDYVSQLPAPATFRAELERLESAGIDTFFNEVYFSFLFPSDTLLEILRRRLPLPEGVDEFVYGDTAILRAIFDEPTLTTAQSAVLSEIETSIIEPLELTLAVFDGKPYMTRLYTTLSADEMTVDPEFVFNSDLDDQPLERRATLTLNCTLTGTEWDLTLGAGTGRDGEVVIKGVGTSPLFAGAPVIDQKAVSTAATLRAVGGPVFVTMNEFAVAQVGDARGGGVLLPLFNACGLGILGASLVSSLLLTVLARTRRVG